MLKKELCYAAALILTLMCPFTGFAQEEEELLTEFSAGLVIGVTDTRVEIMDTELDQQMRFLITDDTEFENFINMQDIQIGDELFIDYMVEEENNVAVNIYKIVEDLDDYEESDEDTYTYEESDDDAYTYGELSDVEQEK